MVIAELELWMLSGCASILCFPLSWMVSSVFKIKHSPKIGKLYYSMLQRIRYTGKRVHYSCMYKGTEKSGQFNFRLQSLDNFPSE